MKGQITLKDIRSYKIRYNQDELDNISPDKINVWNKYVEMKDEKKILIDRIKTGKGLTERVDTSVFISGSVKTDERKEHYDEIQDSDNKIIIATYGVASVGINIPRIFNLVLVESGKSFVRVIQSIGRGIRKAQDKDFVQIWDITSTAKFSKRHLAKRKKFYDEAKYPFNVNKVNYRC